MLLPKPSASGGLDAARSLVDTPSTRCNLRAVAIALSQHAPVLLEGPPGCGKTCLVQHLAQRLGRRLLTIQIGDHTDSKILLGAYVCTNIPGQFRYQVGPLVQAVQAGDWVLVEDVDMSPMEVVSVLLPLLESRELFIPGRGQRVTAASGFQLFATKRTGSHGSPLHHASTLDNLWTRVIVDPPSSVELTSILNGLYPSLQLHSSNMIQAFASIHAFMLQQSVVQTNAREPTLRDLIKWCARVVTLGTFSHIELVFQEALDCFSAILANDAGRAHIASVVATCLQMHDSTAAASQAHVSSVILNARELMLGRVCLPRLPEAAKLPSDGFVYTKQSVQTLEQLAMCVRMRESVLLVGETGTGKTTCVPHLARLLGKRLVVVNMSQQSDSADLLGGFKPVDLRVLMQPALARFEDLFFRTFSRKQNIAFVDRLRLLFSKKKWHPLVQAFLNTFEKASLRGEVDKEGTKPLAPELRTQWNEFGSDMRALSAQLTQASSVAFSFVEGALSKAVQAGDWILLDEINLAAAETLECLSGLLDTQQNSLSLFERGDSEPIARHPDFRLFACMNPPTDVSKKHLSPGLRNRFTELYVLEARVS